MENGDQYAFLAIDADTKLIIHWHIGKRDKENAAEFLQGLKRKVTGRFQLSSDRFTPYTGYLGEVFQTFKKDVDYATESKGFSASFRGGPRRFNPVVCQWVKRTVVSGEPDLSICTTNHAERNNLSVRLFNRRFTRKTMGFSRKLANHRHSVALLVAHFNFCRVHSAHKQTPAVAHGLTDHTWTAKELVSATI